MKEIKTKYPTITYQDSCFMCANSHMSPVIDEERRETRFKTSSEIGGKINKYRAQQQSEHKIKH